MAMVCPQCNGAFEQRLNCPKCNVRLLYHVTRRLDRLGLNDDEDWQQTPWGRLVVRLLLAPGGSYVLRHLCTARMLVTLDEGAGGLATPNRLVLLPTLPAPSVLTGGPLPRAGR